MTTPQTDVHTEHCCIDHGCKYGDEEDCSVTTGKLPQSFACEDCEDVPKPKQLYQFYLSHPDNEFREDATDYIVTLDKLDLLLTDEDFLSTIESHMCNIIGFRVLDNTYQFGNIGVSIQYWDDGELMENTFTLVPVKSFS